MMDFLRFFHIATGPAAPASQPHWRRPRHLRDAARLIAYDLGRWGIIAILFCSAACISNRDKLQSLLDDKQYSAARSLLDDRGVGEVTSSNASKKDIALRGVFTVRVEQDYSRQVDELIRVGRVGLANDKAIEGASLCPWSQTTNDLHAKCEDLLRRIRAAEAKWEHTTFEKSETSRSLLNDIEADRPWILDSEILQAQAVAATNSLLNYCERTLALTRPSLDSASQSVLLKDAALAGADQSSLRLLQKAIEGVRALPREKDLGNVSDQGPIVSVIGDAVREYAKYQAARAPRGILTACTDSAWGAFQDWSDTVLAASLELPTVSSALVSVGENIELQAGLRGVRFRSALGYAHLHRAQRYCRAGVGSVLSMLHLSRAHVLGVAEDDRESLEIAAVAEATYSATPPLSLDVDIDVGPSIDPQLYSLVRTNLSGSIRSRPSAPCQVLLSSGRRGAKTPRLFVRSAELISDMSNVQAVSSSYYSHSQDVPNPRKTYLGVTLESARSSMNSAERAYSSAVASHNIYRTQYSLNSANAAYTRYSMAVDRFNNCVSAYNACPSIISEPVFLPYTFRQGNVSVGWKMSVEWQAPGSASVDLSGESIARDFIRLGTKYSDRQESQRRDDPLDVDVSVEAYLARLESVVSGIKKKLYPLLIPSVSAPMVSCSEEEAVALAWVLHPWGMDHDLARKAGVPGWLCDEAAKLKLARPNTPPPVTRVSQGGTAQLSSLTAERAAVELDQFVCLIRTGDGHMDLSTGSGALIGSAGLILTCAHVLEGPDVNVEFLSGPWTGVYRAEPVFISQEHDVALVRAIDLSNQTWAGVRLASAARKGERVVAIGNPALGSGVTNLGGLSAGVISNPQIDQWGERSMVVDISIASGSSGGPVFSLEDGLILGVVTAVARSPGLASIESGVSSSGYACLAAPASMLDKWLGLEHTP